MTNQMASFGDYTGLGTNGFEVSLGYLTGVPDVGNFSGKNELKLAFKGLLKRDPTTREKSMVELLNYLSNALGDIGDDLLLISWTQMYPKLALDDSKKVRTLSHQIQSLFVSTLGKKYLKYLRDTVGVWLAGLFDIDRSTAKACKISIDEAFGNNETKANSLWKAFLPQILNYPLQLTTKESKDTLSDDRFVTKEDAENKWIRTNHAALLLMTRALAELTDTTNEELNTVIYDFFNSEQTLDSFSHSDFNLKKSNYQALKTLINCKQVKEIIDKKLYKALTKAAVKGLKVDKKKNAILYTNIIIPMLDTLVTLTNYDASFWANTKKSIDRLDDIMSIGSLNSNPVYYDVVVKLLTILPEDFVQWNDPSNVKHYTDYIISSIQKEKAVPFLERGWTVFIIWVLFVLPKLDSSDKLIDSITLEVVKLMDSQRALLPAILKSLHQIPKISNEDRDVMPDINSFIMDALPNGEIDVEGHDYKIKHINSFLLNFINLLIITKSDLLEVLIANAIDSLDDEGDDDKDSNPSLSFEIINIYIKRDVLSFKGVIETCINSLAEYINVNFIELPIDLILNYSKSAMCNVELLNKLVDNVYSKLESIDQVDHLIKVLPSIKNINIHQTSKLSSYLVNNSTRSQTPELTTGNSDILYNFLTLEILQNLYISDPLDNFIMNVDTHYNEEAVLDFVKKDRTFINKLFTQLEDGDNWSSKLLEKIESKLDQDTELMQCYKSSITDFLDISKINLVQSRVLKLSESTIKSIINQDLIEKFQSCTSTVPLKDIAIANSLGDAVYLFGTLSDEKIDTKNITKTISLPILISNLIKETEGLVDLETLFQLGYCSELASDLLFLASNDDIYNEGEIIEFQVIINNEILKVFSSVPIMDVIASFGDQLNNVNQLISYYMHRSLKRVLSDKLEVASLNDFELLDISKLKSIKLQYILLDSSKKFLTSSKLERLRNSFAANLINLRSSKDIMTIGLESLIMMNTFMDLDLDYEVSDSFIMIPPQRFMMVLNSLASWLDCDIGYETEFEPVRQVLIRFVERYTKGVYYVCDSHYPSDFISNVLNLGVRLLSETLNLVNSTDEKDISMGLLNSVLRLMGLLLNGYREQIGETLDESTSDIEDEVIDLFFKMSEGGIGLNNQLFDITCESISKVIETIIPVSKLQGHYERLFKLIESNNVSIQRIGCSILTKLIPKIQDELVVEFTLSKKKINDDGVSDIHLPKILIDIVHSDGLDHLEYEPHYKVYRYLWAWYILMDHFKNITHQMRQDYISELGEECISKFLIFIFEELGDLNKFSIHEDDLEYIKNYSFKSDRQLGYEEEVKKILVNLLFDITNYIGGTFSQTWFQSIRDKQMKTGVELMFKKWISPLLINDILSTLSNKTSIEDDDFKIVINRKFNEVKCLFEIDEQMMEISITLPETYPLSPISVNGVSRIGVDEKKWKSWLMSAQYVINFQNGTVMDAIKHFKSNVRANFENYEDCAICYSILNAVDHSTPNKKCATCKNNFHSACLYRWFKSSGSSTCPLCRSKFQFKRHS